MTNTQKYAFEELEILEQEVPDAIILPFKNEILALCEAFGKSGQSGGSYQYTATALSKAIKTLLIQQPICGVRNNENEWVDRSEYSPGETWYQHKRCGSVFKNEDNKPYYLDAIVWKGEEKWDTFTGRVYVDDKDFELIGSAQYIKFPFKPKTFYIDVIRKPITKQEAEDKNLYYIEDGSGECYYTILKTPKQLDKVFRYYTKKDL